MLRKCSINLLLFIPIRKVHIKRDLLFKKCYQILGVNESSDQNTCRAAYIKLVKKVHPDSGHEEASAEKFSEIDEAFKILLEKFAKGRRGIEDDLEEEVKVFDIQHIAPQHRQFLSYGGFGEGTPFQREKQFQKRRAMKAQENVLEHRLQKAQASDNKSLIKKGGGFYKKHAIKTKYGFDRVVEDLIQEAMSKGDFKNLKGFGKPLSTDQNQNPYVDFTSNKINQILQDNGFAPEWIQLSKEIREEIATIRSQLLVERTKIGELPLKEHEQKFWDEACRKQEKTAQEINRSIDKYNLIVPILDKQMVQIEIKMIADRVLAKGIFGESEMPKDNKAQKQVSNEKASLFTLIGSFFMN